MRHTPANRYKRSMRTVWVFVLVAASIGAPRAYGSEVCRFTGTTDYSAGRLAVTTGTDTSPANGTTTVDVIASFSGTPFPFIDIKYLMEEISIWRSTGLETVAVNSRYIVEGHIIRQEWDVFHRAKDGFDAYRVQGKTFDDFRQKHPGFARHWDPATFGQPWLQDYGRASPERRRDLDLPAPGLQTDVQPPLALAFYWIRHLPPNGGVATVILPGFKRDKSAVMTISPAHAPGAREFVTSVRYPALSMARPSTARAWVSPDGHLQELAAQVQYGDRRASGVIRAEGCSDR